MENTKHSYIPIVILILLFLLLGYFLFSFENYPIDDDWSYIKIAETYHHTGKMQFTPWTAMSLVFQIWWGTCFTKLFGFSIEILRVSTLAISLLGLIAIYLLLRELKHSWQTSFLMVLLILFNPFSFPLNFTFFTDHFFLSLLFISTYGYYKGFKEGKDLYLLGASLAASCALLVRQNGILIPLAVFIYLMLNRQPLKIMVKRTVLTLVIPITAFIIFSYWFNVIHGPTMEYTNQIDKMLENFMKPHLLLIKLVWRPLLILEFIGFCFIPLSFSLLPPVRELVNRTHYLFVLLFCLSVSIFYLVFEHIGLNSTMDLWLNGFRYAYISEYGYRSHLNLLFFFYRIVDFLSVASIVYLIYLAITYRKPIWEKLNLTSPSFLIIVIGILQFLFLFITRHKFARYYLVLIPFLIMFYLEIAKHIRINKKIFIPLLAAYILFSFAIAQDMMSWHQLKWQVANQLKARGISSQKISAGFAWDAWNSCQYSLEHPYEIALQKGDVPWWIDWLLPVVDPQYLISSSPIPSGMESVNYFDPDRYNIIDSAHYFTLFYGRKMNIYVLKREPRSTTCPEGRLFFDFLPNLKGARVRSGKKTPVIEQVSADLGGIRKAAWLQPSPSQVSFMVKLPQGRCRLRAAVGMTPSCWDKPGDGVLYKILIKDVFLENLFQSTGTIAAGQKRQFFKPQTFFLQPRTYFIQYVDPKNKPTERKWQDVCLDLSTFSGKIVEITFEVDAGPLHDDRNDEALWAQPVIESY